MKVKDINIQERPREKAIANGIASLSNRELIAVVLRSGTRQLSALELADEVLNTFENLGELGVSPLHKLMEIHGIKEAKAIELAASFEIGRRIAFDNVLHSKRIEEPEDIVDWMNQQIGYQKQEHFIVLFLNQKNQVITFKTMFIGTMTSASVHPREIFKEAFNVGSAKIICIHNHPSGDPTQSAADVAITKSIEESGKLVAIPLIDHLIISKNKYVSFRQKRLID